MRRQGILLATTVAGGIALVLWFGFLRGVFFGRRLLAMPLGTERSVVVEAMGAPDEVRSTFRLAQHRLHERAYEQAAASDAVEFLVWEYMLDTVCCAGFDSSGRLAVRECGTT